MKQSTLFCLLLHKICWQLLCQNYYVERVSSVCGELTAGKRNLLTKGLEKRILLKIMDNDNTYNVVAAFLVLTCYCVHALTSL